VRQLRGGGLKAAVVGRAEVPYGPVMRARRRTLAELGLIGESDDTEELVVIRGDRAT
jgi:release factor glutamine methyltransferase